MKHLIFYFSFLLFLACGEGLDPATAIKIQFENNTKQIQNGQSLGISLFNPEQFPVSKVSYSIDGTPLSLNNNSITISSTTLGNKEIKAEVTVDEKTVTLKKNLTVLSATSPEIYTYSILNTFPHDTGAYTQGLEFYQDTLYESTGKLGKSSLRKLDYRSGKVLQQIELDETVFGEGLSILNDKIYQLTWQNGVGYIYEREGFRKLKSFTYGKSQEGWGLCNDGTLLYKSDGTEKIWLLDPETLTEQRYIETVTNKSVFNKANELEYVDGKIYANVYQKESMMIIDAQSGAIEGVINFGGLKDKITKGANWDDDNSVLNGVAYHKERKTFFVTGKNWDTLFEVTIEKK